MLPESGLSRREREVMEIIHRLGRATAAEVRAAMTAPPSDAAVRSTLRILVEKGHLEHEYDGPRYVYSPTVPPARARRSVLERVVHTFFDGSTEGVMAALLESRGPLSPEEKERLVRLIQEAEEEEA
jgi:BlaI family transcriptional regulator, penicillinase repressor